MDGAGAERSNVGLYGACVWTHLRDVLNENGGFLATPKCLADTLNSRMAERGLPGTPARKQNSIFVLRSGRCKDLGRPSCIGSVVAFAPRRPFSRCYWPVLQKIQQRRGWGRGATQWSLRQPTTIRMLCSMSCRRSQTQGNKWKPARSRLKTSSENRSK